MINDEIKELILKLDLGVLEQGPTRVMGGLLNRMYKVKTSNGTFAIKHLNPEVMKRSGAKENHILAEKIANKAKGNGIECICAKTFNGEALCKLNGDYFFIYDWLDGKEVLENEIKNSQVIKVAKLMAKLHNIDFGSLKDECKQGILINEVDWDFYIDKLDNNEIKNLLIDNKDYLVSLDKLSSKYAKEIRKDMVVSHRDLDLPNILWGENENLFLIDWESAGKVNPVEEVVETAWDWSGGQNFFDIEKFKLFINTYKENGGNINNLNKAIISNFKNKSAWLEYNLKRICRIECLDDEEQKLGEKEVKRIINEIIFFYKVLENFNID